MTSGLKLSDFKALSFDCYGTLIDWEIGLLDVLRPWADENNISASDDELLEAFAHHEFEEEAEVPSSPYPEILSGVQIAMARQFGVRSRPADRRSLSESVGNWPAFADSADALKRLQKHFKLIVLSNVDNESFARSEEKLGITFDAVYTAEDICSYKPAKANFRYLLSHAKADLGLEPKDILHTAQSLIHDHIPAQKMGLRTCWINRRGDDDGTATGATKPPPEPVEPNLTFTSLAELADAIES